MSDSTSATSVIPPRQIELHVLVLSFTLEPLTNFWFRTGLVPSLSELSSTGCLVVQLYNYVLTCSKDRKIIKFTVFFLFFCDLAQSGLATDYSWKTLVSSWGDPLILQNPPDTAVSLSVVNPIISAIVQIFFAWRIWNLSAEHKWFRAFPVLIVMVALMQAISALVATIRFFAGGGDLTDLPALKPGFTIWLVGSFVADILIAGCMVFILSRARRKSFSKRTESILSRLVVNAIHTGTVTAVAAGVDLALFVRYDDNNYHQAPAFLLGKLYSNVLLANLNARAQHKRLGMPGQYSDTTSRPTGGDSFGLSQFRATGSNISRTRNMNDLEPGVVHIRTEVMSDDDDATNTSKPGIGKLSPCAY
ncbi:hypothetical protein D9758_007982 [Tetrapyrgos nigripes]|uniref:DUF6534 domain-containing protein n=1 Tax=Tetrapyrgos nigripes TaxID=182062 RepID=A0A8H5D1A2_9AGAR|nr:hypothetical protein D9758_007982 [Tetrapyrgos nigripes]